MFIKSNAFVEKQVNTLQLRIVGGGYVWADSAWCGEGVCSPYSRFFFVTKGEAEIVVGSQRTELCPGYVYLLPIGVNHNYFCADAMEKLWFHVNLEQYDGEDLFGGLNACYALPIDSERVERAKEAYFSGSVGGALAVESLIYGAAADFAQVTGVNERPVRDYSPLLRSLFPIVRGSVSSRMTVRSLASLLSVSESTLTKRFRAETGRTLGAYLDDMLMHRARQMLLGEQSIGEIAETMEFCDQFYFSRFFSRHQGMTPSKYRQLMKAQF